VPVLAELARQVAARGPEGQDARARVEMIQRLLLDRIDAEPRAAPVGGQHDRVALTRANEAQSALPVVQPAVARAQVALDAAVVERVPPLRGVRVEGIARHRHAEPPSSPNSSTR